MPKNHDFVRDGNGGAKPPASEVGGKSYISPTKAKELAQRRAAKNDPRVGMWEALLNEGEGKPPMSRAKAVREHEAERRAAGTSEKSYER